MASICYPPTIHNDAISINIHLCNGLMIVITRPFCYFEHHSGLISYTYASADVFLYFEYCPGLILTGLDNYDSPLFYVVRMEKSVVLSNASLLVIFVYMIILNFQCY